MKEFFEKNLSLVLTFAALIVSLVGYLRTKDMNVLQIVGGLALVFATLAKGVSSPRQTINTDTIEKAEIIQDNDNAEVKGQ